jgi:hypothetical protein
MPHEANGWKPGPCVNLTRREPWIGGMTPSSARSNDDVELQSLV